MLIQRNQRTKRRRVQDREQNTVTGSIPREDLALHQRITGVRSQLLTDLFFSLTKSKRLRLSEEVGEEDTVMFGVCDGVVSGCGGEEVCWDEFRALVDELVE